MERYSREDRRVLEHSSEEVVGLKIIGAQGALWLLSGSTLNLSGLDNLNLTTVSDINTTTSLDLKQRLGDMRESLPKVWQVAVVEEGGSMAGD